jgi:hypothetical protein
VPFLPTENSHGKILQKENPHDTAVVADRHNSDEEQDPDPDALQV